MILVLFCLHTGIEAGLIQPIVGLDYDLNSGLLYKVFLGKKDLNHNVYLNLGFCGSYYPGKNAGYSFSSYGITLLMKKMNWRISPFVEFGGDYVSRELHTSKEWGTGLHYAMGFLINFYYEAINIYPMFYYSGITDFRASTGSLGMNLGIGYEF
ncbi:MAG: hypothetical protein ACUVQ4_05170 [bacterium]